MVESPQRRREEDDKQKTMKESYITDMPLDAYKVNFPLGHHRHTVQHTTGCNGHSKRDTKSMTGNRLVLILKVVEQ